MYQNHIKGSSKTDEAKSESRRGIEAPRQKQKRARQSPRLPQWSLRAWVNGCLTLYFVKAYNLYLAKWITLYFVKGRIEINAPIIGGYATKEYLLKSHFDVC